VEHIPGEIRNAHKIYLGKPEGKRLRGPLVSRRPRCRWKDNIKKNIINIEWDSVDWDHVTQDNKCWWSSVNRKV
jgi:hypothetical protein